MEYKIISYDRSFKEKLLVFMRQIAPQFSNAYVAYCVSRADADDEEQPSILVVDENKNIVGCNLFYQTEVMIAGKRLHTVWSHDTYLNQEVRAFMGLDFVLAVNNTAYFGIGLSDINRKILKKLRLTFWDNLYNYCFPTKSFLFSILLRPGKIKALDRICVGNEGFLRVSKASDINIPNDGFWYGGVHDIDFIRDEDFFKTRFFENNTFDYCVYQLQGQYCYFVVRYVKFKGVPTLYVVDYRYDSDKPYQMDLIVSASEALANKSNLGLVLMMSNDKYVAQLTGKKRFLLKKPTDYVATRRVKVNSQMSSFVTAADSDVDYMRQ